MSDGLSRARDPREVEFGELPELTRALRAMGSGRRKASAMQALFFRPLLDARRKAEEARAADARLRAFDAAALELALTQSVDRIVAAWPDGRDAARRAVRTQIMERLHDYVSALHGLRRAAGEVAIAPDDSRLAAWRAWTTQLQTTFRCADRSWLAIESLVSAVPANSRR